MHPQMYPSGTVPLISPYPIHSGFMTTAPPGQPMIPYSQHSEENLPPLRDGQFKALYVSSDQISKKKNQSCSLEILPLNFQT